jgi:hypothetical protein
MADSQPAGWPGVLFSPDFQEKVSHAKGKYLSRAQARSGSNCIKHPI